jgi:hypothetical protein
MQEMRSNIYSANLFLLSLVQALSNGLRSRLHSKSDLEGGDTAGCMPIVLIGNKSDVKQSSALRISEPLPDFKGMTATLSALQLDESKLTPFFEAAMRHKQRSVYIDAGES